MHSLTNKNMDRKDPLPPVLLAVSGLLGALSLYQVAASVEASRAAEVGLSQVLAAGHATEADVQSQVALAKLAAGKLERKNLFNPAAPPRNPVTEVAGILGDEALINGRWYKAGDHVEDALVVAVEPTKVRIKWREQESEFLPICSSGVGGPPSRGPGSAPSRSPGGPSGPPSAARMKVMEARGAAVRRGGPSQEEMAQYMERMRNASPEERQKIRDEMRQRYSGGG
jgi:hypothetical protein